MVVNLHRHKVVNLNQQHMVNLNRQKVVSLTEVCTLSKAIEQSPASILITDSDGKIQFANKQFTVFMQYTLEDVKNKFPRIFKQGHCTPEEFSSMWNTLRSGNIWKCEFQNRKKDKTEFWENVIISPLLDEKLAITNFILIMEDISEKKKLFDDLTLAKEKAEENDRLKSAFLANMSHEIRTPMNGILGFAGLLKEPNLAGEELQSYIELIEKSGARMLNIINDLITISKVESGQMDVTLSYTNLNSQLEFLFNFFKTEASQKGLELKLHCQLASGEAVVTTDSEKFLSVFSNLIKNALKFTKNGGVDFGYTMKDQKFEFYVEDTGIGIPTDKQKVIFDRFVQADSSLSRGYEGAGLGLSISKAYVEMLGGIIWLESEVGIGTRIRFTIPFQAHSNYTLPSKNPDHETKKLSQNTGKVLIVEDDEDSLMFLSIILKNMGCTLLTANSGVQAVQICHQYPDIDLILMDIKMPLMDGHTAAKMIRSFRPQLPIIAQTAYALEKEKEKYGHIFTSYLTKPINAEELRQKINKFIVVPSV